MMSMTDDRGGPKTDRVDDVSEVSHYVITLVEHELVSV
jgi:hypothetical protein